MNLFCERSLPIRPRVLRAIVNLIRKRATAVMACVSETATPLDEVQERRRHAARFSSLAVWNIQLFPRCFATHHYGTSYAVQGMHLQSRLGYNHGECLV